MVRETEEEPKEDGAWSLWSGEAPLSWTCELLPPAHVQRIQLPSPPWLLYSHSHQRRSRLEAHALLHCQHLKLPAMQPPVVSSPFLTSSHSIDLSWQRPDAKKAPSCSTININGRMARRSAGWAYIRFRLVFPQARIPRIKYRAHSMARHGRR